MSRTGMLCGLSGCHRERRGEGTRQQTGNLLTYLEQVARSVFADPFSRKRSAMMTPGILLLTTTLMHSANAGIQPLHCDRQALGERAEQIDQAAFDATAVRLFALRIGLCLMIDADMIDRTTAARILEHQRELSIDEDLIERDPWGDPGSAY